MKNDIGTSLGLFRRAEVSECKGQAMFSIDEIQMYDLMTKLKYICLCLLLQIFFTQHTIEDIQPNEV